MRKYLKILTTLVILSFFTIAGYLVFDVSPREFFHDGVTFGYINEEIGSKDLDEFIDFLEKIDVKIDREAFNKFQKSVKGIYLFEDESLFLDKRDPILILETGPEYFLYLLKLDRYFDRADNLYILKDEVTEKHGIDRFFKGKIYMYPYRGNFIFSTDSKKIFKFIDQRTVVGDEAAEFFDKKMSGNLGIAFFNLKKDNFFGINTLSMIFDYKEHHLETLSIIFLRETELKANDKKTQDNLAKFIEKNRVYLNIPEYIKIFDIGRKYLLKDEKLEFLLGFWQTILGIDIPRLLGDIDSEIIYDLKRAEGIIKFSDTERAEKMVEVSKGKTVLGLDHQLKMRGNYLYIGTGELEPSKGERLNLPNNQIIYFEGENEGETVKIEAFNYQKIIRIYTKFNDEALKKIIDKKIERKVMKNDKDT